MRLCRRVRRIGSTAAFLRTISAEKCSAYFRMVARWIIKGADTTNIEISVISTMARSAAPMVFLLMSFIAAPASSKSGAGIGSGSMGIPFLSGRLGDNKEDYDQIERGIAYYKNRKGP